MFLLRLIVTALAVMAGAGMPVSTVRAQDAADSPQIFVNPGMRGQTVSAGTLRQLQILTVANFAPFTNAGPDGSLTGIHVDMARDLCRRLSVPGACTLTAVSEDQAREMITTGQADLSLSGMRPDADLRKSVHFTPPYFRFAGRFITRRVAPADANEKPGEITTGVMRGTVHQAFLTAAFPTRKTVVFDNDALMLAALREGRIQSVFGDSVRLGFWLGSRDAGNCCVFDGGGYLMARISDDMLRGATPASRAGIADRIDAAIVDMQTDGTLNEILLRHIPFDPYGF